MLGNCLCSVTIYIDDALCFQQVLTSLCLVQFNIIIMGFHCNQIGVKKKLKLGNRYCRQPMHNITNEQFSNCITAFNEALIANLIIDKEYTLSIKNNYIKKVNFDKSYLFTSIEMSKKDNAEVVRIDFTVSYHDFYQVPVLNIRPYKDGSFTALNGIGLQVAPTVITALTTHHILQKTWIEVHACETLEALQTLPEIHGTTVDPVLEYLCCWFGFYGLPAIFPNIRFRPHLYI